MGRPTRQDIFCQHDPAYARTHRLPAHVRQAARAILRRRPAALGGHVQAGPEGPCSRIWYTSCRHRSCPQCASLQIERWVASQQARLVACDHSHGMFPLPHARNALWLGHVEVLSRLVFHAAREPFFALLGDTPQLGAQPGVLAARPTWSQTWVLPPHLHCWVTGGGLHPEGQWVAGRHGCWLPARGVLAVLRGKMGAGLRPAQERSELPVPEGMRTPQLVTRLHRLGHRRQTRWHVRIMERDAHGRGVVRYLARSLRGGPITPARLGASTGARVTWRYRGRAAEADGGSPCSQCLP